MKKIYTVTTQYANNMGALLQCYALCYYLNQQKNIECKVLNYLPQNYLLSWNIWRRPSNFKGLVKIMYQSTQFKYIKDRKNRNKLVKQFISKYIPLSDFTYNRNTLLSNPPDADVFICGSDQIWNRELFKDNSYYLDFVDKIPNAKRISYATSIADPWPNDFLVEASSLLKKFSLISVREKGNIEQVQSLVPYLKVQWVCDPVFLLSAKEWNKIMQQPIENEPYILCYFLDTPQLAVETVKKIRKMTGLKVIHFSLNVVEHYHSDKVIWAHDPTKFIGYIKNATYICTNSFHCSAFSIIYRKNFIFLPKTWANERILSLQEIFKIDVIMTKEKLTNLSLDNINVNYSEEGINNGNEFIEQSKLYLEKAIN